MKPNRILIIRLSSMGDVILTTHIPKILKERFPDSEIHFLTFSAFQEIYKYNPFVNKTILFDKSKDKLFDFKNNILKNFGKYDVVIDLHKNYRSRFFSFFLGKKIYKVRKNRLKKILLVKYKKNLFKNIELIPDIYLETCKELIPDYRQLKNEKLQLWIGEDSESGNYLSGNESHKAKKRIAIAPGAKHFTKRWLPEYFSQLLQSLYEINAEIVLLGGKEDFELCQSIINNSGINAANESGKSSILETAEILDTCDLLITNDSGIMHIAAARQIPILAIFGSTVKDFGFTPYNVKHKIIEIEVLTCRPCTHIGTSECKEKHFACMKAIYPIEVLEEAKIILNIK